jgi:nickel superoxide dismutase
MQHFLKQLLQSIPVQTLYAHCDVPCGIYDPHGAQLAAKTVLVMIQKMKALTKDGDSDIAKLTYKNNLTRMIVTKEQHADICKKEMLILWTDYFKPEHLEKFPNLHETIWKAAKLCSYNKQHVDEEKATELIAAVDEIAEIFAQTRPQAPGATATSGQAKAAK